MIKIDNKSQCCGCRACEQICPLHCIEIKTDNEGFGYPEVCLEQCIDCRACESVCPCSGDKYMSMDKELAEQQVISYGCRTRNEDIRKESSSGGCFTSFAEAIISKGGCVFACVLDKDNRAIITRADCIAELKEMRGSKYVQSDTCMTYSEIKDILHTGRLVLFVGTPCQAAGLYSFLGDKKYNNLFIMDFICHGVPSPKLFDDYIKQIERKYNGNVTLFRFRNKDKGWSQTGLQLGTYFELDNGMKERKYPAFRDKYMNAFLDDVALRPSCYKCNFKSIYKEYADFTVGDFWGVKKIAPELDDGLGTSLILIHSEKGLELWNEISNSFTYKAVDLKKAIVRNQPLIKSAKKFSRREKFFNDYIEFGYGFIEKKYMSALVWASHKILSIIFKSWEKAGQFIKFGLVGVSNTAISLGVYYACLLFGMHYIFAYTLGFCISVCNAFYWNNKYVFKNKHEQNEKKAFAKSFASYGGSFLLSIVLLSFMVDLLKIPSAIAPVLKMVITIPINFLLNKIWAFKDKK